MTKLVTGIEAIQSGKEVRQHYRSGKIGSWFRPRNGTCFDFDDLTTPCFEIKQEPREFWLDWEQKYVYPIDASKHPGWIRVREVLDDE